MALAILHCLHLVLKFDYHVVLAFDILNQNITLVLQLFDLLDTLQQVTIVVTRVYCRTYVQALLQKAHAVEELLPGLRRLTQSEIAHAALVSQLIL